MVNFSHPFQTQLSWVNEQSLKTSRNIHSFNTVLEPEDSSTPYSTLDLYRSRMNHQDTHRIFRQGKVPVKVDLIADTFIVE